MNNKRCEILNDLAARVAARLFQKSYCSYSLLGNDFGEVMFLYYYSRIDNRYEHIADKLLGKIFHSMKYMPLIGTYCNGLAGLGYGLTILQEDGFIAICDEAMQQLDERINSTLADYLQKGTIDFLHGFVGYGFYFLKRYAIDPGNEKRRLMSIVNRLHQLAIKQGDCIKWQFSDEPEKRYNISLSHGMASVIVLLCKIADTVDLTTNERDGIEQTISGAVNYLLSQRIDHEKYGSWFVSSSIECEVVTRRSRLGWCYGDPGVSVALYDAGTTLGRTNLKDLAAALGRDAEELYNILMRDAVKEWLRHGNKLPVVVVIETIDDISRRSPELAALLKDFIVSCGITYEELGERHGMSRAMAH